MQVRALSLAAVTLVVLMAPVAPERASAVTAPFTCPAGPAVTVGPAWTVSGPRVVKDTPTLAQVACDFYREVPGGFPVYPERAYIFVSWVPKGARVPSDIPSGVCGLGSASPETAPSSGLYAWAAVNGQWWSGAPGDGDISAAALDLGAQLLSSLGSIARACPAQEPPAPTVSPDDGEAVAGGPAALRADVVADTKVRYHVWIYDKGGRELREVPHRAWSGLVDVSNGTLTVSLAVMPAKAARWCIRIVDTRGQRSAISCAAIRIAEDDDAPEVIALGGDLAVLAYRVLDNSGRSREQIAIGFANEMVQTVRVPMHAARGQLIQVPWIPDSRILAGIREGRSVLMCVVSLDPAGNRSDAGPEADAACEIVSPTITDR